ncbi:hypothetical protein PanWU01x14_239090 [Parasponia andersonii]|uniref:Uncharacterized protein n=1 Tax=Parasponia andersonii TaxID=3476 RepID=A0A2P5BH37_PARAD|nr:hypothetical protein PanWU01x14_239090 [Parasponia andersonii]
MALHLNYTMPFEFFWKPKDKALNYRKMLVSGKEVIKMMKKLGRHKYKKVEVLLVMPEKVMELECMEENDAIKHHPGLELFKRCIIEELVEDADIQGIKVVTSQAQSQHSYIDLGAEVKIACGSRNHTQNKPVEYEASVNEPGKNEVAVNESTENKDNQKQKAENVTREEKLMFVQDEYAQYDEEERNIDHKPDASCNWGSVTQLCEDNDAGSEGGIEFEQDLQSLNEGNDHNDTIRKSK